MREWAGWALTRDYVRGALGFDATHFHRIDAPMWFFDISDDTYAPPAATAALRGWYTRAQKTHRTITPAELGRTKLGHFDCFRTGIAEPMWREIYTAITGEALAQAHPKAQEGMASMV